MFNKNDPLIGSVKQVMAENQFRRDVEKQLNEELGITTKKGLPFEYHAEYDALLEQRIAEAKEGSIPNTPKEKSLARLHGDPNRITHGDVLKGRGVVEEEGEEKYIGPDRNTGTFRKTNPDGSVIDRNKATGKEVEKVPVAGIYFPKPKRLDTPQQGEEPRPQTPPPVPNNSQRNPLSPPELRRNPLPTQEPRERSRLFNEEGEETREGGAVTRNGKTVVSPTAHKAEPEGPSKSDRDALTAKIKGIMKEAAQLEEKKLTDAEMAKREEIVKSMKKGAKGFKSRYGKRAKEVMYATATKQAKKLAEEQFDLDAVMEEIRANLGEEAFAALMNEQVPRNVPLPPRRPETGPAGTASQRQYPSNPRGDTVTGIQKTKGGDYNIYGKGSESAKEFQSMYAAARKPGADGQRFATFSWQGRSYSTGLKGGKGEYKSPVQAATARPRTDGTPEQETRANQVQQRDQETIGNAAAQSGPVNRQGLPLRPGQPPITNIETPAQRGVPFTPRLGGNVTQGRDIGRAATPGTADNKQVQQNRAQGGSDIHPSVKGTFADPAELAKQRQQAPVRPDGVPSRTRTPAAASQPQDQPKKRDDTSGMTTGGGIMPEQRTVAYMRESLESTIRKVLKG